MLLRDMRGTEPHGLSAESVDGSSSANARNEGIRYNAPSQGVMQSKPEEPCSVQKASI